MFTFSLTHSAAYTIRLATTQEDKDKFLSSVITTLEKTDDLAKSAANAHAHAMRARLTTDPERAVSDAQRATQLDPTNSLAWRALADAHESSGNIQEAAKAWANFARRNPAFSRKAANEIERLKTNS